MRVSLWVASLAGVLALAARPAAADLVTWMTTDVDGPGNGITADLMIGSDLVGTATITRRDVVGFNTAPNAWEGGSGVGLNVLEDAPNITAPSSISYDVVLDSVAQGWEFGGFGLSQYSPSGPGPWIANPNYAFTFNSGSGALATVSELGPDYFSNANNGETFGSGSILNSNGNVSGRADGQILWNEANEWSIAFDPAITDYTLTYSNGVDVLVNDESLFFMANFAPAAVPEPSSMALLGLVGAVGMARGYVRRRRRRNS